MNMRASRTQMTSSDNERYMNLLRISPENAGRNALFQVAPNKQPTTKSYGSAALALQGYMTAKNSIGGLSGGYGGSVGGVKNNSNVPNVPLKYTNAYQPVGNEVVGSSKIFYDVNSFKAQNKSRPNCPMADIPIQSQFELRRRFRISHYRHHSQNPNANQYSSHASNQYSNHYHYHNQQTVGRAAMNKLARQNNETAATPVITTVSNSSGDVPMIWSQKRKISKTYSKIKGRRLTRKRSSRSENLSDFHSLPIPKSKCSEIMDDSSSDSDNEWNEEKAQREAMTINRVYNEYVIDEELNRSQEEFCRLYNNVLEKIAYNYSKNENDASNAMELHNGLVDNDIYFDANEFTTTHDSYSYSFNNTTTTTTTTSFSYSKDHVDRDLKGEKVQYLYMNNNRPQQQQQFSQNNVHIKQSHHIHKSVKKHQKSTNVNYDIESDHYIIRANTDMKYKIINYIKKKNINVTGKHTTVGSHEQKHFTANFNVTSNHYTYTNEDFNSFLQMQEHDLKPQEAQEAQDFCILDLPNEETAKATQVHKQSRKQSTKSERRAPANILEPIKVSNIEPTKPNPAESLNELINDFAIAAGPLESKEEEEAQAGGSSMSDTHSLQTEKSFTTTNSTVTTAHRSNEEVSHDMENTMRSLINSLYFDEVLKPLYNSKDSKKTNDSSQQQQQELPQQDDLKEKEPMELFNLPQSYKSEWDDYCSVFESSTVSQLREKSSSSALHQNAESPISNDLPSPRPSKADVATATIEVSSFDTNSILSGFEELKYNIARNCISCEAVLCSSNFTDTQAPLSLCQEQTELPTQPLNGQEVAA